MRLMEGLYTKRWIGSERAGNLSTPIMTHSKAPIAAFHIQTYKSITTGVAFKSQIEKLI